jgi:hypothetical protein
VCDSRVCCAMFGSSCDLVHETIGFLFSEVNAS